jgi:hypothetical protein
VAQSYKLRLSDGTVLVVDAAGLSTWLVDAKAMVQVGSSQEWHPLKEFLARERAATRRAARQRTASPSRDPLERELPLVPPPPRKEPTTPPRDPLERELPLVPPPPRREATPTPPRNDDALAEPTPLFAGEPVELSIGTPPDVQVLAEEPQRTSKLEAATAVTRPPLEGKTGGEEVFLSLPPKRADEDEDPLRTVLPPSAAPEHPLPPAPSPPAAPEDPLPPVEAPAAAPVASRPISEPVSVQVLAEEPTSPASEATTTRPALDDFPAIRLKPSDSAPPVRRAPPPRERPRPVVPTEAPSPIAAPWRDPEPVAPPAVRPREAPTPLEPAPVIRLKPLDDEPPRSRPSPSPWRDVAPEEEEPVPPARRRRSGEPRGAEIALTSFLRSPLGQKVWRATDRLGALLSRGLAPVNRLERGLPLFSPDDDGSSRAPLSVPGGPPPPTASPGAWTAPPDESAPAIPLKPRDDGGTALALDRVRARASAWVGSVATRVRGLAGPLGGVFARLQGLVRRERSPAPTRSPASGVEGVTREPTPPSYRAYDSAPASAGLHPSPPLEAPPHLEQLPVLRFKEAREPEEVEDVYDGDETAYGVSVLPAAWLWTKRLVLTAALVGGAIFAALTWRTWFPRAARLGQTTFTEIDRHARSREVASQQRSAVEEASGALPQLAPETIRLVMAGSPTGVLEAPEVFHAASDAADRGSSTLTPAEAEELRTLRRDLLDALSPEERESVLSYEHARASRAVFPFEDRAVVPLLAHGVRALPPESQERLQALLGKAVAAGLDQAADGVPDGAPEP